MSSVLQILQAALDQNSGHIPFGEFMRIALHHPQGGYYAQNIRGIGTRGDFTTAPQMTPALAAAIARWLRDEASRRGWKTFHIIECGAGSGTLAADVIKNFGWWERRRIRLHIVETSEPLRAEQRRKLARRKTSWHADIQAALAACDGRALIYHNEFYDAFPCRVFRRENGDWLELHLRVDGGRLREEFLPPERSLPDADVFRKSWPDGQRVEVFEDVRRWLHALARSWREGSMLAVDYGGGTEAIYHRRPHGTLRAYRGHQCLSGGAVYEMPGRQDITADVNFDDLENWGGASGWAVSPHRPLREFAPEAPGSEAFRCLVCRRSPAFSSLVRCRP